MPLSGVATLLTLCLNSSLNSLLRLGSESRRGAVVVASLLSITGGKSTIIFILQTVLFYGIYMKQDMCQYLTEEVIV